MPKDDPPARTRQAHLSDFHNLTESVVDYEAIRKKLRGVKWKAQ
jgi:hypothetical protein